MKKYINYKSSGIPWLGNVPKHWKVLPFKFCAKINNGADYKDVISNEEDGFPVIGSGGQFAFASKYMYDGPVVLLGRKGTIDRPLYFDGPFWAVDTMFYAYPLKGNICKYLYYQALTFPFTYYATATALPSMTQSDLGNNKVVLPPIEEQKSIVAYLDAQCEKIDKAIATQQKRIDLLKELRQNIITRAVSRGMNEDCIMKNSGLVWLGDIPQHWRIIRLKYIISLLTDYDANGSFSDIAKNCNINNGNPYAWMVRMTDMENKRFGIIEGNNYCDEATYKYLKKSSLIPGDIIIAKRGSIGKSFLVPECDCPMTLAPNTYLIKTHKKLINNRFLYYYLTSGPGVTNLVFMNKSTTLGAIYKDDVRAMQIPLPPKKEQDEIVRFLDVKIAQIDRLIERVDYQISELGKYKQSVITEAVTGKVNLYN